MAAAIGAGVAGGVLLWLAGPAVGAGWVGWIALVPPAAVALRDPVGPCGRIAPPLAYTVALWLLLVPALPFGLTEGQYGDLPAPLIVGGSPLPLVALVLVPALGLLLWAVRFGQPWPAPRAGRRQIVLLVVSPAAMWAGFDFLRMKLDPGASWGPLFLTQHDLPAASLAALGGPALLSFAVALAGYLVALALVRRGRATAAACGVGAALLVAAAALSSEVAGTRGPPMTIAAVQPGYDTAVEGRFPLLRFRRGSYDLAAQDLIVDLTPLTMRAARAGARVVAWPEAAFFVDPVATEPVRSELVRLARRLDVTLVVPYFVRNRRHNEAVVVSPSGAISRPLAKQRPMWFWDEDGGNREEPAPVEAGGIRIGTLLGVDNQDLSIARRLADAGAELIVSSTHDWRQLAAPQRAFSRLAATATATPILRADWRYGSAVFDAGGEERASAGEGLEREVVVATVRTRGGSTPYAHLGDVFGWAALAIAAALGLGGAALGGVGRLLAAERPVEHPDALDEGNNGGATPDPMP